MRGFHRRPHVELQLRRRFRAQGLHHAERFEHGALDDLARAIALGHRERVLQSNPHLVVLSAAFYHVSIKPLLARWMLEWFKAPSQSGLALPLVTVSFLLCTVTFTRILLTV